LESIKILVVDDEASIRKILYESLTEVGRFSVEVASNGLEAMEKIEANVFDLVLTDVKMPEMDGIELLRMIKGSRPDVMVILMTAFGSIETAVEVMKIGADDYVTKPVDFNNLLIRISKAHKESCLQRENRLLRMEVKKKYEFGNIIGKSKKMQEVFSLIEKVAPSNSTVVIYGGSGTGKELVAKAIHYHSPRNTFPFVPLNCGAIPETLIEGELFGHTKGAFTGAVQTRKGLFEEAKGGTLFLDEISTLPPSAQVKLLRVLQEKELMRLGSPERIKLDVRVVAATSENLEARMRKGEFREDLFYRLHVFPIFLPDLKERKEDIHLLAYFFLDLFNRENQKKIKGISKEAMNLLLQYHWPGNVRELENVIERGVILADQDYLTPQEIPPYLGMGSPATVTHGDRTRKSLNDVKTEYIMEILKEVGGDKRIAAEILKIDPKTIHRFERKNFQLNS
jgi:DNA-binding NtrC family response regulator